MANLPSSCPVGSTSNVTGRLLDAGAHVFHVEHPCFTAGAANHTQQIQAAVDATLLNPADPTVGAGTVVFEPGKVYMVDSVNLPAGITLDLNGATIKRIAPPTGESPAVTKERRTFTTQNRAWNSSVDSPVLTIRGGTMDGNRTVQGAYTGYQLEQAHLIFLMGNPASAGRLRARVEDMVFVDAVADAVEVYVNTDLQLSNVLTRDIFRGGLVVTGGHTKVQATNLRTTGDVHLAGVDVEVDGAGFGGSLVVDVQMANVQCEGDFSLAVQPGSTVLASNLFVRKPRWTLNGGGQPAAGAKPALVRFTNSIFALGLNDTYENRIVHPGDMAFTGCTFEVTEARETGEANRPLGLDVYWNVATTNFQHQRLRFTDCIWRVAGDVEAADQVNALTTSFDPVANDNRLVVDNAEIPAGFDVGVFVTQGGNVEIRGGRIQAATPIYFGVAGGGYDVDLTLNGLDVTGAGKYMHLVGYTAGSVIRTFNVVMAEADSGITSGFGVQNQYVGGRVILVDSSPVLRIPGLQGDIARLRVPVPGQTFEWVCSTGNEGAQWAVWKPLTTLSA